MNDDDPTPPPPRPWWRHALEWGGWLVLGVILLQVVGSLRAPDLPDAAPDFALPDLHGQTVSLSDLRGQTVVLNFWATWCGPCRVEIPSFSAFADANPDITVLGIAADGPVPKLRKSATELGITYPVLVGDRDVLARYGVTTFPTTVVVGPDGEVRAAHTGMMFRPQLAWATW